MTPHRFPHPKASVCAIGECMIEIASGGDGQCRRGFGGDTLNTAIYLARQNIDVSYVTALGDDSYSDKMITSWQDEGINTDLVSRQAGGLPGLYMIETDSSGERRFSYWRNASPARKLFDDMSAAVSDKIARFDVLYLSGITLSLYDSQARKKLFSLLDKARMQGGCVVFDSNYRPAGWRSAAQARETYIEMLKRTDIALPTFEDESDLFADSNPDDTAIRLHEYGVREIVIKQGREGCLIYSGDMAAVRVAADIVPNPVDTTAAGDSFNAGYLAARCQGKPPAAAALHGHDVAAKVICHRGAIIPNAVSLS